jgi:hypothetical protein
MELLKIKYTTLCTRLLNSDKIEEKKREKNPIQILPPQFT